MTTLLGLLENTIDLLNTTITEKDKEIASLNLTIHNQAKKLDEKDKKIKDLEGKINQ